MMSHMHIMDVLRAFASGSTPRRRLMLAGAFLLGAVLASACALAVLFSRGEASSAARQYQGLLARNFADDIRIRLDTQLLFLTGLGRAPDFRVLDRRVLDARLKGFLRYNPLYKNIWIYDAGGSVVTLDNILYPASEREEKIRSHIGENFNQNDNDFKRTANEVLSTGRPAVAKIFVSDPGYLLLPCVAPIVADGRIIGIISAGLFMNDINLMLAGLTFPPEGWSMLTQDAKRIVGYHGPAGLPPPDIGALTVETERGRALLADAAAVFPSGRIVWNGKRYLLTIQPIKELNLELLIAMPEQDAAPFPGPFTRGLFVLGFLLLVLGAALVLPLAAGRSAPQGSEIP